MRRLKPGLVLFVCLFFGSQALFAQNEFIVKGRVTASNDGQVLVGASVVETGTRNGVITDMDGSFVIACSKPGTLTVHCMGYKTEEVKVSKATVLQIQLKDDAKLLNEVVVTALGIKREARALGYAVTELGGDEVNETRPINAISSLSGKVPGVDISMTTAGPSGSTRVVIRGNGELSGDNQPLYVIDGVPMDNSQLGSAGKWGGYDMGDGISSINPDDIETISVLKGASAAALYGSRATHGVILITTKSATKKGIGVDFSTSIDIVNQLSKFDDYQRVYGAGRNGELPTTYEQAQGIATSAWGAKMNKELKFQLFNKQFKPYTNVANNVSNFFRTGTTFTNSLSFTAGGEKADFRASVSDMRNQDIVPGSGMSRTSFMVKGTARLSKRISVEARANYIVENVKNRPALSDSPNNVGLSLIGIAPNIDQRWLGEGYKDVYGKYVDWNGGNIYRINPYWSINEMSNKSKKDRVMGHIQFNYEIIDGLNFMLRAGTDFYKFRMTDFSAMTTPTAKTGAMQETSVSVAENNYEATLRYSHKFANILDFSAFVGGNIMTYNQETSVIGGENQVIPGLQSITNYVSNTVGYSHPRKQVRSVYGAINLGYKDFLYLDFTLRNDWSSTLARGKNSYLYPSVSGSFVFSNLIKGDSPLSFGKFRASWAEVGGDTGAYMLNLNYGLLDFTLNGMPLGTISSVSIPKYDLKPTRTYSYEFGIDLRFFKSRLNLDATYYHQMTKDQIMSLPISNSTGYTNTTINSGKILNHGVEISLNGMLIDKRDLTWDATFNFAKNMNKVVSLHSEVKDYLLSEARWAGAMIEAVEGEAYGSIVGKAFQRDPEGNVIFGSNGMPLISEDLKVLGNGVYDWTAGFGTSLKWKGLQVGVLFDFKIGADVYSMSSMLAHQNGTSLETLEGRQEWYESEELRKQANALTTEWTPTGGYIGKGVVNIGTSENPEYVPNTTPVDPQKYWAYIGTSATPEPFIYDASFIKLRELTLGYSLPKKVLAKGPLTDVTFSLYGRNLATLWSNIPNIDPESSYNNGNGQGFEYGSLPSRRNFGFCVKLSF